jgi:phosphatidylinositol-3-phosphatase
MNPRTVRGVAWLAVAAGLAVMGCSGSPSPVDRSASQTPWPTGSPAAAAGPTASGPIASGAASSDPTTGGGPPDHVLIVVFENKALSQTDGSAQAPYLNSLAKHSAVYTDFRALTHPSQPNYIALFSGSTHGVRDDHCPVRLRGQPNLGRQLLDAGRTFVGYSEGMPAPGYTGCSSGRYARKHNPWVDFDNLPAAVNQPATAMPTDYAKLPTVAFLIPDLCNDMHDCRVHTGDDWARRVLDPYARWAQQHNSLLVVTFDEDNGSKQNRILTLLSGARVPPGRYGQRLTLYSLLGTVERWYGLPLLGGAATAPVMTPAWTG